MNERRITMQKKWSTVRNLTKFIQNSFKHEQKFNMYGEQHHDPIAWMGSKYQGASFSCTTYLEPKHGCVEDKRLSEGD
jgi:hypothetical protein